MVKIRLTRLGDKKSPFYRIVVSDGRVSRDGQYIDLIGTYNPLTDPAEVKVDVEKAKKWLESGAQPTDTVKAILVREGAMAAGKKAPAKTKTAKKKKE